MSLSPSFYTTYNGPLNPLSQDPILSFIAKYAAKVDSKDLSQSFDAWYAPSATFYNSDGLIYTGGHDIWTWMRTLFAQFEKVEHDILITRVLSSVNKTGPEGGKCGDLVLLDCTTTFWLQGELAGDGIMVPRMLSFLVGEAEGDGMGTDGLQILEAKAWWDSGVLMKEMMMRKQKTEQAK